jgi:hypothetical protein
MKSYNTAYYLLTVLLITGAFASMAQNEYGMTILSGVSIAFALLFLIQLIGHIRSPVQTNRSDQFEFLILFLLASIFFFRTLQIFVPFIEGIFGAAGIFLALIYLIKTIQNFDRLRSNSTLSILVLISYLSIVLFCIAMVMIKPAPQLARWIGGAAILCTVIFLVAAFFRTSFVVAGEKTNIISAIGFNRDRFYLLLSLLIIFCLYIGLTGDGILPGLYSDNYPQSYYRLINQAESGKEKPVNGQYKYQAFKKMYDDYVNKNLSTDNK